MKTSGFKNAHPVSNFLFFLAVLTLSFLAMHPITLAVSFFGGMLCDLHLRGKKAAKTVACVILPMILLITLINGLFNHYGVTVLFVMRSGNSFTLEALVYGFVSGVKIASVLLWFDCFNEVITSDKFIFLFGRISPRTALVFSMTLRFVPMLRQGFAEIERSRRGLGFSSKCGNFKQRLKNAAHTLSILVSWVLESAIDTSSSMRARGYGLRGRTSYNQYVFSLRDIGLCIFTAVCFALSAFSLTQLHAVYNPIIELTADGAFAFVGTVSFILLCLLPPVLDRHTFTETTVRKRRGIGNENPNDLILKPKGN